MAGSPDKSQEGITIFFLRFQSTKADLKLSFYLFFFFFESRKCGQRCTGRRCLGYRRMRIRWHSHGSPTPGTKRPRRGGR